MLPPCLSDVVGVNFVLHAYLTDTGLTFNWAGGSWLCTGIQSGAGGCSGVDAGGSDADAAKWPPGGDATDERRRAFLPPARAVANFLVAQICNLLYRRVALGQPPDLANRSPPFRGPRRIQFCEMPERDSARRSWLVRAGVPLLHWVCRLQPTRPGTSA